MDLSPTRVWLPKKMDKTKERAARNIQNDLPFHGCGQWREYEQQAFGGLVPRMWNTDSHRLLEFFEHGVVHVYDHCVVQMEDCMDVMRGIPYKTHTPVVKII